MTAVKIDFVGAVKKALDGTKLDEQIGERLSDLVASCKATDERTLERDEKAPKHKTVPTEGQVQAIVRDVLNTGGLASLIADAITAEAFRAAKAVLEPAAATSTR